MKKSDSEEGDEKNVCYGGELFEIARAFLLDKYNYIQYMDFKDAEDEGEDFEFEDLDRLPQEVYDHVRLVYDTWLYEGHIIDEPILIPEGSPVCEACRLWSGEEICLGCGHSCIGNHISQLCIGECSAEREFCKRQTVNCPDGVHVCLECLHTKCSNCGNLKFDARGNLNGYCKKCDSYTDNDSDSDADVDADSDADADADSDAE